MFSRALSFSSIDLTLLTKRYKAHKLITSVSRSRVGLQSIFEDAGTRTLDLSTKHAKRVRFSSALHPRSLERADALYIGDQTLRGPRSPHAYTSFHHLKCVGDSNQLDIF